MTKQAYLDQLRKYLKKLPAADYADAMEDVYKRQPFVSPCT